jgi:hypothetical protein
LAHALLPEQERERFINYLLPRREVIMKRTCRTTFLIVMMVVFFCGTGFAVKPGNDVNPNGFQSGPHYNLNIISKKDTFQCPDQEYYLRITETSEESQYYEGQLVKQCPDEFGIVCEETNEPIYGNVIFVPELGTGIEILMQSGSGKGKKTEAITEFQVIDPCTGFPGEGSATLQLPPNANGYDVYARALAKPTDNPSMVITPELVAVEDDSGNDLIYLGLVTDSGFVTSTSDPLVRTKGKSTAVPITGLFEWSGSVIYFDSAYFPESCMTSVLCCADTSDPLDGIYDVCVDPDSITGLCPDGYETLEVCVVEYVNEWVFNIGDFVTYLWNLENNGLKLLQVRFYPR